MKCPLDQTELLITERQGVEIDYCPTCRGVWLDRGELDKLIERADAYDNRNRDKDDDRDNNRNRDDRPYQPQPTRGEATRGVHANDFDQSRNQSQGRSPGADIAGMVGDVLKKKLDERNRGDYNRDYPRHKKKKGGLLGDLFDF